MSTATTSSNNEPKQEIRLNIPPRFIIIPGTAVIIGCATGIVNGGRTASMRFLAENAHRPPTTVQGWYFYKKTKNYRVMLGGLKGAGRDASKMGAIALGYVTLEEGLGRLGWGSAKYIGATVGTAVVFSVVARLPIHVARRTVGLGGIGGAVMTGLDYFR
ncbi:hypothetical protein CPC08DRAFT_632407 [Agrocybe pediades]|nr:hypothetical protein CPC08DRAFT_632407 [Agrocybe pediades]